MTINLPSHLEHFTGNLQAMGKFSSPPTADEIDAYLANRERELGDITAEIIKRTGVGATYKTVLSWVKNVPVGEINCGGCYERQEMLNNLSRRFRRWWRATAKGNQ